MTRIPLLNVLRQRLGLVGASLLLCSIAVPLVLATVVLDGAAQPETYVAGDGAPQVIHVPDGRAMMVWADSSVTEPECAVEDHTGHALELDAVANPPRQSAGSAGDWVGTHTFETDGDSATVTCEGVGQPPVGALVTPTPGSLSGLSEIAVLITVALTLATAGLAFLARADTRSRVPVA